VFFSEEEAIMRAQQLELIYSQSSMLYEIFPDAPRSNFDKTKKKFGLHPNVIVGSSQSKPTYQLTNKLQNLSIQQTVANQTLSSVAPVTQTSDVHGVQSKNPKGNQQIEGKRKSKNKKGNRDNKAANNVGDGKNEKRKVNFLCDLCMDDHLTHQCPQLEEFQNLLA
jgi:hypothetical protein